MTKSIISFDLSAVIQLSQKPIEIKEKPPELCPIPGCIRIRPITSGIKKKKAILKDGTLRIYLQPFNKRRKFCYAHTKRVQRVGNPLFKICRKCGIKFEASEISSVSFCSDYKISLMDEIKPKYLIRRKRCLFCAVFFWVKRRGQKICHKYRCNRAFEWGIHLPIFLGKNNA